VYAPGLYTGYGVKTLPAFEKESKKGRGMRRAAMLLVLLLLWAIGDGVANLRRHGSFKEAIAGPLFLTTGIGLSIIAPEMIVSVARISGVNAASWMGGLYETIFGFPSNLATGSSFDLQALLAYVHVFSENEGRIMTFAVALGTGMLVWQAWKSRSGSVLRGLSIFIFTFGFSRKYWFVLFLKS